MEVILLSSDDIPPSSPSGPNLTAHHASGNALRSDVCPSKNGKGKEVWKNRSASPGHDSFHHLDLSANRHPDQAPFSVRRTEIIDPISRWGGLAQNVDYFTSPKRSRWQLGEDDEVIVIDDTPAKPPGRFVPSPVGPFTTLNDGFSTTTASILADLLGSELSPDAELDEIGRPFGHQDRGHFTNAPKLNHTKPASKKRRSDVGDDSDIQDSHGTCTIKGKKKRSTRDDENLDRQPGSLARKNESRLTEVQREKRAEEKARKAAQKDAEREVKRAMKEAKELEKQKELELGTVNKLKASKKDSIKEIIVDISESFAQSPSGQQLLRFLETQECESTVDWNPSMPNVIKWRRKVVADWNEELGYFVPISQTIREEKHILVVVKANDFVDMAVGETDLDGHVNKIKALLREGGSKPIYVIEGLTALLRKSKNAKNRSFQGAVREAIGAPSEEGNSGNSRSRASRDRKGPRVIDEDMVEDALLSLQITHGCLVHHTVSMQETSEWISVFTGDISRIPYKLSRMNYDTSFCAEVGQVKPGNDVEDTYFKMLQEITRVTAGVAHGIMGEYKSVRELINACRHEDAAIIADLEIMVSKTGISSGRKIGRATSKRLHQFFTGQDSDSADL